MNQVLRLIHGVGIALDYGIAMLIWFRINDPMTVSSHAGLALRGGERCTLLALIGRALNALFPNHCEDAIAADIVRCNTSLARLTYPSCWRNPK